jgi:hypothetical protein
VFTALSGAFINFQTQALSNVADFVITWPVSNTVGQFRRAGFSLIGSGKIQVIFSAEAATQGALANAGSLFASSGIPLGYIDLECTNSSGFFKTAGSVTNIIENAQIYRFGAGAGGGSSTSGSGLGDDLGTLRFKASFGEDFSDVDAVNQTAGFTDGSLYSVVSEYFRLAYDATKTVSTTGTAATMSAAPTFTVKAGDIVRSGTEARRIASISSQTSYTLESAFSSNLSSAACTVSQAVHTVDLRDFDASGEGLAINDVISDNLSSFLMFYRDSEADGDIIFDEGVTPLVAYQASADNSTFSSVLTRVTDLTTDESIQSVPVAGSQARFRFFSNKSSGSGFVNLLDYKVFLHEEAFATSGDVLNQAYCLTDGSGTELNCSVSSSSGKTRVQLSWSYPVGISAGQAQGSLEVYLDGKLLPRFVDSTITADAYYVEVSDSVIELDSDYSGLGLSLLIKRTVGVIDNTSVNASNISSLQQLMIASGIDGLVDQSATVAVPFTAIVNRRRIPDLANNLSARMGVRRVHVNQIALVQDEFGAQGEAVWKPVNDNTDQIRFVGTWSTFAGATGQRAGTVSTINDYVEVTFYGTGLNALMGLDSTTRDYRVSVDGGAEGANINPASISGVLYNRNYSANTIVPITSNLALGLHTVKIRSNSANGMYFYGFEILNESANINVRPGSAFASGRKVALASAQNISPSATFDSITREGASVGTLGARGARVVTYLKSDGTIGKSAYAVNSAQGNLGSADHTYEEVLRSYNPREFGAGRSDDFSAGTSVINRAFTLEDGTTSLAATNAGTSILFSGAEGIYLSNTTDSLMITFVGTGLDYVIEDYETNARLEIIVDGVSVGTRGAPSALDRAIQYKAVSGLPYGTHTVRIRNASLSGGTFDSGSISRLIVYQPRKPSIPAGAIELADYNVMADFVANSTSGLGTMGTGVLRKYPVREFFYQGGWSMSSVAPQNYSGGFTPAGGSVANGSFAQLPFFGTGFEFRFYTDPSYSSNNLITINGLAATTANFPTATFSVTSPATFNSATGVLSQSATNGPERTLRVSGLPLGFYTFRATQNSGGTAVMDVAALDVITPVHSPLSEEPFDISNTLPVGSIGIRDTRKTSILDLQEQRKFRAVSYGLTNPSTSSTSFVPVPNTQIIIPSKGGWFEADFLTGAYSTVANGAAYIRFTVNGSPVGQPTYTQPPSIGSVIQFTHKAVFYLPPGVHHLQVQFRTSTGTLQFTSNVDDSSATRQLTVKEL